MEGARRVACVRGTSRARPRRRPTTLAPGLQVELVDVSPAESCLLATSRTGALRDRQPVGAAGDGAGGNTLGRRPGGGVRADRAARDRADGAAVLDLDFARGVPVAVNGVHVPLLELLEIVTTIAGDHGIGRQQRGDPSRAGERLVARVAGRRDVLGLAHAALEAVRHRRRPARGEAGLQPGLS
jgi:hypothetical protein